MPFFFLLHVHVLFFKIRGLTGVTTWESIDLLIDFLSQYVEILTYIFDVFGSFRFRRFGGIFLNCLVCVSLLVLGSRVLVLVGVCGSSFF